MKFATIDNNFSSVRAITGALERDKNNHVVGRISEVEAPPEVGS